MGRLMDSYPPVGSRMRETESPVYWALRQLKEELGWRDLQLISFPIPEKGQVGYRLEGKMAAGQPFIQNLGTLQASQMLEAQEVQIANRLYRLLVSARAEERRKRDLWKEAVATGEQRWRTKDEEELERAYLESQGERFLTDKAEWVRVLAETKKPLVITKKPERESPRRKEPPTMKKRPIHFESEGEGE